MPRRDRQPGRGLPCPGRHGQEPPSGDDPVLRRSSEALARNPDLHAAQSAVAAAQLATERARVLPDPMVSVTYTNDGGRRARQHADDDAGVHVEPVAAMPGSAISSRLAEPGRSSSLRSRGGWLSGRRAGHGLLLARELRR
jgi:hypothetical protein